MNTTGPAVSSVESGVETTLPAILVGLILPHAVCTLFIVARIWSRLYFVRRWFVDDTLIVLAWASSTAVCVLYVFATQTPDIEDAVLLSSDDTDFGDLGTTNTQAIQDYILRTYLGLIFYQFCLCVTKLSVLAFYVRMFKPRPVERRLAWTTVVFVLLYGGPLLLMSGFQCHPLSSTFSLSGFKCFEFRPLLIASAVLHTVTDAWLIILIIPCIARLDLPRRQKIALGLVLSLSVFVIAAAMARLELSLHANYGPSGDGVDVTSTLMFFIVTILENDIALICASAPTLRPLIARLLPHWDVTDLVRRVSGGANNSSSGAVEENSANLTAISYHGYPWTRPASPQSGHKTSDQSEHAESAPAPVDIEKQAAVSADTSSINAQLKDEARAPTTLPAPLPSRSAPPTPVIRPPSRAKLGGLRNIINGFAGMTRRVAGSTRASTALSTRLTNRSTRTASDRDDRLSIISKPSLLGFERYFERQAGESSPRSQAALLSRARWSSSQESFVMGDNDPASPMRLSPKRSSPLAEVMSPSTSTFPGQI